MHAHRKDTLFFGADGSVEGSFQVSIDSVFSDGHSEVCLSLDAVSGEQFK